MSAGAAAHPGRGGGGEGPAASGPGQARGAYDIVQYSARY